MTSFLIFVTCTQNSWARSRAKNLFFFRENQLFCYINEKKKKTLQIKNPFYKGQNPSNGWNSTSHTKV